MQMTVEYKLVVSLMPVPLIENSRESSFHISILVECDVKSIKTLLKFEDIKMIMQQ
jgi:hypothetical protein